MAPPMRGSPDMPTYQGGMACKGFGTNCLGNIPWQSTSSVEGMWNYFQIININIVTIIIFQKKKRTRARAVDGCSRRNISSEEQKNG
jgi:hypothetical protein